MLFHLSIDADDPRNVANVIAELWGGHAFPFPPVLTGSWVAMAGDDRGTTVEVYPRGAELHEAPGDADASVPIVRLRDMNGVFEESITRPRLLAQLLGGFAGLALLLAAIGTYGVLSYMVAERRREIGIRMALGAEPGGIQRLVLRRVGVLLGLGVAAGLALSVWASGFVQTMLFQLCTNRRR